MNLNSNGRVHPSDLLNRFEYNALSTKRTKKARRTFDGIALDVHGCAGLLGTSSRAIRSMVCKRIIPFRKLAGRVLFVRAEIESWLTKLSGCSPDEALRNLNLRSL